MAFPHPRRDRRPLVLAAIAVLVVLAYAGMTRFIIHDTAQHEVVFPPLVQSDDPPLRIYADIQAVSPVRASIDVKLSFAIRVAATGVRFGARAPHEVMLKLHDGATDRQVILPGQEPMRPVDLDLDIAAGAVDAYPFDAYRADLTIEAFRRLPSGELAPIPVHLTVWNAPAIWAVSTARAAAADSSGITLTIGVRRPLPHILFATTIYAAMVLIAAIALTVGTLTFLGIRRLDTTLAAVMAAMLFSVPALRNLMPGSPPVGVLADNLVFLWAELSVLLGLALMAVTWVKAERGG